MKILVIDDDELVRMTCRSILKKAGYTVFEAQDGNIGMKVFKSEKPDLVITDILMPDKEGLETIAEIRALKPDAKIIAISSGGNTQNMSFLKLAKTLGADRALKKPIRPAELVDIVKATLNT